MKTKVKATTYLMPIIVMGFLGLCYIGMTLDNTVIIYSWQWWLLGIVLLGLFFIFRASFRKIPKIEIANNIIHSNSNGKQLNFEISEIEKIERVDSKINGWYSLRGGLKIYSRKGILLFPYYIYSNETELLKQIYQITKTEISPTGKFNFSNISFIKYFYRNLFSLFLIPVIGFVFILLNKEISRTPGVVIIVVIVLLLLSVILKTFRYVKLDNGYLYYINPLIMYSCKFDVESIEHVNSRITSTGKGGIKNLTIELADKQILTLNAGLNRQKKLDEIAYKLNMRSNNSSSF